METNKHEREGVSVCGLDALLTSVLKVRWLRAQRIWAEYPPGHSEGRARTRWLLEFQDQLEAMPAVQRQSIFGTTQLPWKTNPES